jgi:hypothetical protein
MWGMASLLPKSGDCGGRMRITAATLNQLQSLEARMPVPADNQMIVHLDAEPARDLDDLPGHLDVGARRCRVSSGTIVHQDS